MEPIVRTDLPLPLHKRGKVRDVYDLGPHLLIVATDRISAFDHVLSPGIPGKGILLTQLSNFWFGRLGGAIPHHIVETDADRFPEECRPHREILSGRAVLVRRTEVIPVECVARGYLVGSGWKEYSETGTVCGIELPAGLTMAASLPEPIFTPATKADEGHDMNISFDEMVGIVGGETAEKMRELTLSLFARAATYAEERGIILADTKLEFGLMDGRLTLIDEIFTSDSSRYWPADRYAPGSSPPSFDKQFVRDYLLSTDWDRIGPPPPLPPDVVSKTLDKYREAYTALTGVPAPA